MFKDDYIIRMIEQFGDVLRKVLALEDKSDFKAAHDEIDAAMQKLGMSRLLARTMPAETLLGLVRRPGGDDGRCIMLSRLISADAHVYETEGRHETAHDLYATSLFILTSLKKDAEGDRLDTINRDMDSLRFYIGESQKEPNGDLTL